MSNKNQDKKNISLSMNVIQFINIVRKNKAQKDFSKIIQNFKNLFHQKFMKIEKADKIFVA